jgi:hypothetical protein
MSEAETEEKAIRQERQQSAAERRRRNALAIAEVVGRNPTKKPLVRNHSPAPLPQCGHLLRKIRP